VSEEKPYKPHVAVFFSQKSEQGKDAEGKPLPDNQCWGCGEEDKTLPGAPTIVMSGEAVAEYCAKCSTEILEQMLRLYLRAFHGKEPTWPIRKIRKLDEEKEVIGD